MQENKLFIRIQSFSYKKGLPSDPTEHGGGYVFDCRCVLNPGRLDQYKFLTGRDEAVGDFLRTSTQMPAYLQTVYELLNMTIIQYGERGFDYLSVAFGCTGGQHRSVFAAQSTYQYLQAHYPTIRLSLTHRELE